jgi:predicted SAM-dependent methyltransferase
MITQLADGRYAFEKSLRDKAYDVQGPCLNLGCGTKKLTYALNVDIDPHRQPDLICDLNHTPFPFPSSHFSYIIMRHVYEHLYVHSVELFQEVHRLLVPNGHLDLVNPNMFSWKNRWRYLVGTISESPEWHPYHSKLVRLGYVSDLLRNIGFEVAYIGKLTRFGYELVNDDIHILARKRQ